MSNFNMAWGSLFGALSACSVVKQSAHPAVVCAVLFAGIFGAYEAPFFFGRSVGWISTLSVTTGVAADRAGTNRLDGGAH
jgi:hypothetical protein